jgi:uncharacterized protein (TIGR02271 family)
MPYTQSVPDKRQRPRTGQNGAACGPAASVNQRAAVWSADSGGVSMANMREQQTRPNMPGQQAAAGQQAQARTQARSDQEWVDRREERLQVGKESYETGHVRLHRYVDAEPVERTVHLAHEEFDVERLPVNAGEPVRGNVSEVQQEITLHGERAVMHKETVPVERVRLVTKNVEEDKTFRDEIRRERIEIEPDQQSMPADSQRKPHPV